MSQEITSKSVKTAQRDAEWAYNTAMEKFYYSMLEIIFLKIKTHLNAEGLKKVLDMDEKRNNDENFGIEFSQKTWKFLAESWEGTEGLAMTKIADLYGLTLADLDISKIEKLNARPTTQRVDPTNS